MIIDICYLSLCHTLPKKIFRNFYREVVAFGVEVEYSRMFCGDPSGFLVAEILEFGINSYIREWSADYE